MQLLSCKILKFQWPDAIVYFSESAHPWWQLRIAEQGLRSTTTGPGLPARGKASPRSFLPLSSPTNFVCGLNRGAPFPALTWILKWTSEGLNARIVFPTYTHTKKVRRAGWAIQRFSSSLGPIYHRSRSSV